MSTATERALRDQIVLSPAAKRVVAYLNARKHFPGNGDQIAEAKTASSPWARLLVSDLDALIHDQDRLHEFWAESEKQKRIIAALVEIIDGPRVEDAPLVAASADAIQTQIDTQGRRDEALKQARWIASEFPADCAEDGCTVVDGKCLDCGKGAGR